MAQQYSVPQFTDVEDKIIGPLTLKQFFVLLGGGIVLLVLYRFTGNIWIFFLFGLPIMGITVILAFGQYNGKSVVAIIFYSFHYILEPRSYIFHRQVGALPIKAPKVEKEKMTAQKLSPEERLSRLKKLTYILDQEREAEENLIKDSYLHLK